jgi:hypothetical protein
MIVAVKSRTDLLSARINLSAQGSSFTQPDVQRPQNAPPVLLFMNCEVTALRYNESASRRADSHGGFRGENSERRLP